MTSGAFLETFVSLAVQTSVVIFVAGLLSRRRFSLSPVALDRLWTATFVALLLLTASALLLPHLRLVSLAPLAPANLRTIFVVEAHLGTALSGLWLVGVAVGLFRLVGSGIVVARLLHQVHPLNRPPIPFDFSGRNSSNPAIVTSEQVSVPFCWQFHRPLIVLPSGAESFPEDELAVVLRHESEHLRAGHPVRLFLQRIVEMLLWIHPLLPWASRHAELARELRCDAAAATTREARLSLLRSLLRLATLPRRPTRPTAILSFAGERSLLQNRVSCLTAEYSDTPLPSNGPWPIAMLLASALCCSCLWLPVSATASDRAILSPWPAWTSQTLRSLGVFVRDYEFDAFRQEPLTGLRGPKP